MAIIGHAPLDRLGVDFGRRVIGHQKSGAASADIFVLFCGKNAIETGIEFFLAHNYG